MSDDEDTAARQEQVRRTVQHYRERMREIEWEEGEKARGDAALGPAYLVLRRAEARLLIETEGAPDSLARYDPAANPELERFREGLRVRLRAWAEGRGPAPSAGFVDALPADDPVWTEVAARLFPDEPSAGA